MTHQTCDHCGARLSGRWERVTPGLVNMLIKFRQAIHAKGKNDVNPNRDCQMTHSELANFQKLRFHGLVAHVEEEGERASGRWLITRRGQDFLRGVVAIAPEVFIFRNQIEKRTDKDSVFLKDIFKKDMPYFDEIHDFKYEPSKKDFFL